MGTLNKSGNVTVSDKFLYIEPNDTFGENNEPVSLEDLSVYFDLRVEYRPQRYITANTHGGETLYFRCSLDKEGRYTGILTTSKNKYNNHFFSTKSYGNYTLPRLKLGGNEELLGIESINITYNSFMVPEVEIKFVDIKGAALHGAEELTHDDDGELIESSDCTTKFLSCFFTVPFPRFEMVIKGYYGQPVFYDLTCADFRSTFDSKSGNYNIVAKLVGYSFGLISDITMSSILAAPYSTYYGKDYWEEQTTKGSFQIEGKPMPTLQQIVATWNDKMEEINALRESNNEEVEQIKLQNLQQSIQAQSYGYEKVLQYIRYLKQMISSETDRNFYDENKKILIIFSNTVYEDIGQTIQTYKATWDVETQQYNRIYSEIWGENKIINEHISGLKEVLGQDYYDWGKIEKAQFYHFKGKTNDIYTFLKEKLEPKKLDIETLNLITELFKELYFDDEHTRTIYIYLYDFYDIIDRLTVQVQLGITELNNEQVSIENELNRELSNILGFKPTIENFSKICFAHLETLLYMFKCVKTIESNKPSEYTEIDTGKKYNNPFQIFPECRTTVIENGVYKRQEKWIGEHLPDREEIKFIRGMFEGIKKGINNSNILPLNTKRAELSFQCICPLDLFKKENPFSQCVDGLLTDEILYSRCSELFVFGVNRMSYQAEIMGKIDAQNYKQMFPNGYNGIINDIISKKWSINFFPKAIQNEVKDIRNSDTFKQIATEFDLLGNKKIDNELVKNIMAYDTNLMLFRIVDDGSLDGYQMYSWAKGEEVILTVDTTQSWGGKDTDTCFRFNNYINNLTAYIVPKVENVNEINSIKDTWYLNFNFGKEKSPSGNILFDYKLSEKVVLRNKGANDKLLNPLDDTKSMFPEYEWTLNEDGSYKYDGNKYCPIQTVACHSGMNSSLYSIIAIPGYEKGNFSLRNGTLFSQKIYKDETNIYLKAFLFLQSFYWGKDLTNSGEEGIVDKEDNRMQEVRTNLNNVDFHLIKNENGKYFNRNIDKSLTFKNWSCVDYDYRFIEVAPLFYVLKAASLLYCYEKDLITYTKYSDFYQMYALEMSSLAELKPSYKSHMCQFFEKWVNNTYKRWDAVFQNAEIEENNLYYISFFVDIDNSYNINNLTDAFDLFGRLAKGEISFEQYKNLVNADDADDYHFKILRFFRQTHPIVEEMTEQLFSNVVWYKYNPTSSDISSKYKAYTINAVLHKLLGINIESVPFTDYPAVAVTDSLRLYMKGFGASLETLFSNEISSTIKAELKISKADEELEFQLYRHYKQLWDRWICGGKNSYDEWRLENVFDENKSRIHFIDSSYNKIGQLVPVNFEKFAELVQGCVGQENLTFLTFLSYFYKDNNCVLFNIQNFYDNQNDENVKRIFDPVPYTEVSWEDMKDFSDLVVMFSYHPADSMEDSFNINESIISELPEQLRQLVEGNYRVPAIGVTYGTQNQNYFIDIDVSMKTPTVTDQSLQAYLRIAEENSKNSGSDTSSKVKGIGQDSFQVFSNHAYECSVTMMGCAWIQPLMYFQLLNVPLFRGAYIIQKVSHSISQGHMITKFSGMRISRKAMKIVEQAQIFSQKNMIQTLYDLNETERASLDNNCPYAFFNPYGEDGKNVEKYKIDLNQYFDTKIPVDTIEMNMVTLFGLTFSKTATLYEIGENNHNKIIDRFIILMHNFWIRFREDFEIEDVFNKFLNDFSSIIYNFNDDVEEVERYYEENKDDVDYCSRRIRALFNNPGLTNTVPNLNMVDGVIKKEKNIENKFTVVEEFGALQFISNAYDVPRAYFGLGAAELENGGKITIDDLINSFNKTAAATRSLSDVKIIKEKEVNVNGTTRALIGVENKNLNNDILGAVYDMILQTYGKTFLRGVVWVVKDINSAHEMWEHIGIELATNSLFDVKVGYISKEDEIFIETIDNYNNLNEKFYTSILKKYSYNKLHKSIDDAFKNDCKNFVSLITENVEGEENTTEIVEDWKTKVCNFIASNENTKGIVIEPCDGAKAGRDYYIGGDSDNTIELPTQEYNGFQFDGAEGDEHILYNGLSMQLFPTQPNYGNSTSSVELLLARNGLEEMPYGSEDMKKKATAYSLYAHDHANPQSEGMCAYGVRTALENALKTFRTDGRPNSASRYVKVLRFWGFTLIYEGMHSEYKDGYVNGDIIVTAGLDLPEVDENGKQIIHHYNSKGEPVTNRHMRFGHIQVYYEGKWYADKEFNSANVYSSGGDRPCCLFRAFDDIIYKSYNNSGLIVKDGKVYWGDEYIYDEGWDWQPSENIINQIKDFEGFVPNWYIDNGNLAIGYGFNITDDLKEKFPVNEDKIGDNTYSVMTQEEADEYLREIVIPPRVEALKRIMRDMMYYNQKQMDALFDLLYNVGHGNLTNEKSPNLMRNLKFRNINKICEEMNHGWQIAGVRKRRLWEQTLFKTNLNDPYPPFSW